MQEGWVTGCGNEDKQKGCVQQEKEMAMVQCD